MGRSYVYDCSKCNFTARVCGGKDNGANCFLQTHVCYDCRCLYDMVSHARLPSAIALITRTGAGITHSRFPRKIAPAELKPFLPAHVVFSPDVVNPRPQLPEGLLLGRPDPRWVELAIRCAVANHHRIEPWQHPGRCPRCQTFLDRGLIPFRVWD